MASIHIHQDLYNFERKHKGFTNRQLVGMGAGAFVCIGMTVLLGYVFGLDYTIACTVGLMCAFGPIIAGFSPVWGMPAEVWFTKYTMHARRGCVLTYEGECAPPMEGAPSREYQKKKGKRAYERDC